MASLARLVACFTLRLDASFAADEVVPSKDGLSFLAVGDWGGESDEEPSTVAQRMTGESMSKTFRDLGASFTFMLGDNFYSHGIDADSDAWSMRFLQTFEQVYAEHLPGMPFYAMAGNHDYGEGKLSNVSAQLAYSQRSKQWRFPALWYKVRREFEAGGHRRTLDVLVTDSIVLCGIRHRPERHGIEAAIDQELQFLGGQCDPTRPGELRSRVAEEHWAWIERELAASDADYLWVVGHYPIWSAGIDGETPCLVERLQPLLLSYGAHYMSGHDHNMEHFAKEDFHTFVVGAGKECCYTPDHLADVPPGLTQWALVGHKGSQTDPPVGFPVESGYASVQFGADAAEVAFYAHNGATLYTSPPIPRRNRCSIPSIGAVDTFACWAAGSEAVLLATVGVVLVSAACLLAAVLRHRKRGYLGSWCDEAWSQEASVRFLA